MSYGKVHDLFWEDDRIEALSDQAAFMAVFLMSGPHRNAIGCFKLGVGQITDNARFSRWGIEGVSKALRELCGIGFIVRDDRTGWTFIRNAMKYDPIISPKNAVHALSLSEKVPKRTEVYRALVEKLRPQLDAYSQTLSGKSGYPIACPIDGDGMGDAKPVRSPEPLPEPLPEPEPAPEPAVLIAPESVGDKSPRETSEAEKREIRSICEAFNAELETAFAEKAPPYPHASNSVTAKRMVLAGATADFCRPIFAATLAKMAFGGKPPPKSLSYFTDAIADALAQSCVPMPEGKSDAELLAIPRFLDARTKRPANGFDAAVAAARSLVAGE